MKSIKREIYLFFSLICVTFVHEEILLTILDVTLNVDMKKVFLSAASVLSASPVGDVKDENSVSRSAEEEQAWRDVLDEYGNPDVVVIVDASRGNEPNGAVLVYDAGGMDNEGFFVYDGVAVDKKSVVDVTFHNAAMPYVANAYYIVISIKDDNERKIQIYAGNDVMWAREVCEEIKKCILCKKNYTKTL